MRISHRHRFVFLSYPRTASRSIRSLLDPYSDIESTNITRVSDKSPFSHHMPAKEAKAIFDDRDWDWFGFARFCVARNPYARIVSLYHHHRQMRKMGAPGLALFPKIKARIKYSLTPVPSFRDFVLKTVKNRRIAMPLHDFIFDDSGNCLVDDVLRFESLADELPAYLQRLGIKTQAAEMPEVGISGIQSYRAFFDDSTRRFVADFYQYEIDRFEYSFEDLD